MKIKKNLSRVTPLTKEETEYLAAEILARLRDIFFMQSEKQANEMAQRLSRLTFNETESFSFIYEVTMLGADVLQIVGGKRRSLR